MSTPIENNTAGLQEILQQVNELPTGGAPGNAVLYTEQALTPEQQSQARENIGASPVNIYTGPIEPTDENIQIWVNPDEEPENVPSKTVQTDWNQTDETAPDFLKNKPFGEVGATETLTVLSKTEEEIEGLVNSGSLVANMFLKISNSVLTMSDLENGFNVFMLNEIHEVPAESVGDVVIPAFDGIIMVADVLVSVDGKAAGVEIEGFSFPEKGLYLVAEVLLGSAYVINIPGYRGFASIKKIDAKYLPDKALVYTDETYLYRDVELTVKYNAGELPPFDSFLVSIAGVITIMPIVVLPGIASGYPYDIVGVSLASGYTTYKTSEYTPT